jgi:bifunctional DNA-binding transcriptional regulator/antitoxin component of YhaV-PrlF toxin-antitoxin module
MSTTHVMKVSSNGQVSIPAEARARWKVDRVLVVDLGDRVVSRVVVTERRLRRMRKTRT